MKEDSFYRREFTRGKIRARLLKAAAKVWNVPEASIENFDPVVKMLLGVNAYEFERVAAEIYNAETRALDRLANLLIPGEITGATPAHCVIEAKPIEPKHHTEVGEQFIIEREFKDTNNYGQVEKRQVAFSPVLTMPVFNAQLLYVANSDRLMEVQGGLSYEEILQTGIGFSFEEHTTWLGISLNENISELKDFSLFFDWKNVPEKLNLLNRLKDTKAFINGHKVALNTGLPIRNRITRNADGKKEKLLSDILNLQQKVMDSVKAYYAMHYLCIDEGVNLKDVSLNHFPKEFVKHFHEDDLKQLKVNCLWIKLQFPTDIPENLISELFVGINAVPMVNKQYNKGINPHIISKGLNNIPLRTKDKLLYVSKIYGEKGVEYNQIPFKQYREKQAGTFSVRSNSIERFDERKASELLTNIIEIMRDERVAFMAIDDQSASGYLKSLEKAFGQLERHLKKLPSIGEEVNFVMVNTPDDTEIWIDYWSTYGAFANKIPSGSEAKPIQGTPYQASSCFTLTVSCGGKDYLNEPERIQKFKSTLLSRGSIHTLADIEALIMAHVADLVETLKVDTVYKESANPKIGFKKVFVVKMKATQDREQELSDMLPELQQYLESYDIFKNRVILKINT